MNRHNYLQTLALVILLGSYSGFCAHRVSNLDTINVKYEINDHPHVDGNYVIFSYTEVVNFRRRHFLKIFKGGLDYKVGGLKWPDGFSAQDDWILEFKDHSKIPRLFLFLEYYDALSGSPQEAKKSHKWAKKKAPNSLTREDFESSQEIKIVSNLGIGVGVIEY